MAQQSPYNNQDGLTLKFGQEEHKSLHGGGQIAGHSDIGEQVSEVEVVLSELSNATTDILNYSAWIPHDALITRVRLVSLISATESGTALFSVGLAYYATDGSSTLTDLDANGLIAAHLVGSMAVGEVTEFGLAADSTINDTYLNTITTGGALIGTELASTAQRYYVTAEVDDANLFTAGVVKVSVFWMPLGVNVRSTVTELT